MRRRTSLARSNARKRESAPGARREYDEGAIQTLDALEHIRLRTGMYIGRVGDGSHHDDGVYVMLKEVVDNAVDEFIMGQGKRVEIRRDGDTVHVRDYGRGIPLGKVVECVSQINTGGKFNDDVFQFSVGLNGVGTKAVNALSSLFEVTSYRDGRYKRARFSQGRLVEEKAGIDTKAKRGTEISFTPDPEIFSRLLWNEDFIEHRLSYYAYLNAGLSLVYNGRVFRSKEGLKDLLAAEVGDEMDALYEPVHCRLDRLEFAFTHTHNYGETYFSFVNGQYTSSGGTHQSAFREAVLKAVNDFSGKSFAGEDVRDGIIGAVAIRMKDPIFESQTKNKLGSPDVRAWILTDVKREVAKWLHTHKAEAEALLEKVRTNERLRKELSAIKKQAKERARKVAIRVPKLTDCKEHFDDPKAARREGSTIFITEGDSAGGAMVQARDVYTQAIFSLKGKPLNTYGAKREAIYKNEELYNIMRALGIEDGLDGLRYNRVVIATDADVDGMHIRNLLLTYFLRYFEELVTKGHVYILETPLFRVRTKAETIYCYSELERDRAKKKLKKNIEITRFKGLGEINPKEFEQFIGEKMRLVLVNVKNIGEINKTLDFFMGKNTPARKKFIVENLVTDLA
ncbi:MAG: type IIA DNA topoisomerase subunit B [Deltaproteobacteria bacterium]|nr:type IIA DNA topoisomerase subunit B [Deltaproteobacteria bacterium]